MNSNTPSSRFRIRLEDGSEIAVSSVEALARRMARGELLPDTPLFDASIGGWKPAGEVAVVRFILEEVVREIGRFPDGWSEESVIGTPVIDARAGGRGLRAALDLSGFTIVDPITSEPSPSKTRDRGLSPGTPTRDPDADETLREADVVLPIETTGDWMRSGLGGGFDDSLPGTSSTESEWGEDPTLAERSVSQKGGAFADRNARTWTRRFLPAILIVGLILGGIWIWSDRVGRSVSYLVEVGNLQRPTRVIDTSLPYIEMPSPAPPPPGLESDVERTLEVFGERIRAEIEVSRSELGIARTPPVEWLTGYYMANASEFPSIPAFWDGYRSLVEDLHGEEEAIFLTLLGEEAERMAGTDPDQARIFHDYLLNRWETALPARDALFGHLVLIADTSLELQEFLVSNQASLRFTPALGSQVPSDPVLEVEATDPIVEDSLSAHLDRVLLALDRSRTEGVQVMDGIEAALYSAIESF